MKYEYSAKQRHLPLHTDQSILSLTIALNEQDNMIEIKRNLDTQQNDGVNVSSSSVSIVGSNVGGYSGGGTYFEAMNETIVSIP